MTRRQYQRFAINATRPAGKAKARYRRAMSSWRSRLTIAIRPKSRTVLTKIRLYSSGPLPITRIDLVRKTLRVAIHMSTRTSDTAV